MTEDNDPNDLLGGRMAISRRLSSDGASPWLRPASPPPSSASSPTGAQLEGAHSVRGHPHDTAGILDFELPVLQSIRWDASGMAVLGFLLIFGAKWSVLHPRGMRRSRRRNRANPPRCQTTRPASGAHTCACTLLITGRD